MSVSCSECGKAFRDLRGLQGHIRIGHGFDKEKVAAVIDGMKAEVAQTKLAFELDDLIDELMDTDERIGHAHSEGARGFYYSKNISEVLKHGLRVRVKQILVRILEIYEELGESDCDFAKSIRERGVLKAGADVDDWVRPNIDLEGRTKVVKVK